MLFADEIEINNLEKALQAADGKVIDLESENETLLKDKNQYKEKADVSFCKILPNTSMLFRACIMYLTTGNLSTVFIPLEGLRRMSMCPSVYLSVQNTGFCQSTGRGIKSHLVTALVFAALQ